MRPFAAGQPWHWRPAPPGKPARGEPAASGPPPTALIVLLAACLLAAPGPGAVAEDLVTAPAGLRARVHLPEEIAAGLVHRAGRVFLLQPGAGELELLTGPRDPRSRRPADAFHPHAAADVRAALLGLQGIAPRVEIDVFLLPAPPVEPQASFCRGRAVFLSPGYLPVPAATTAYALMHEVGHALSSAYLDPLPERWRAYEALRGLSPQRNGPAAAHAERAREILAEDVRHLFGGAAAGGSGTIENSGLPLPEQVAGLRELLVACFDGEPPGRPSGCAVWPNPCNPAATVRLELPPGAAPAEGELTVWDCRGRLVRTLRGGLARPGELSFVWDGRDESGRPCAGGRYLCRIRAGDREGRAGLTLLR